MSEPRPCDAVPVQAHHPACLLPPVTAALRFLDPNATIKASRNNLPHWQQDGRTYFVTFPLGDSIPADLLAAWGSEWEIWIRHHPPPWSAQVELEYHRRFSHQIEHWLDRVHGSCILRSEQPQRIVAEALMYFEGVRARQHAWVVMPNHVHALFSMVEGFAIEKLLLSWKSFSSRAIGRITGVGGPLWQTDYFDRLIRDETHFFNCARYIRKNPTKARLKAGEYALYESELVKRLLG